MARIPLINPETGRVDAVIVADYTDPPVPNYYFGPEGAQVGWYWNGTGYTDPNPPPEPTPQGAPNVVQ